MGLEKLQRQAYPKLNDCIELQGVTFRKCKKWSFKEPWELFQKKKRALGVIDSRIRLKLK